MEMAALEKIKVNYKILLDDSMSLAPDVEQMERMMEEYAKEVAWEVWTHLFMKYECQAALREKVTFTELYPHLQRTQRKLFEEWYAKNIEK